MGAKRVTWVYTDGSRPETLEVTAGPAKAHTYLSGGVARLVDGADVYEAWCEQEGVEPAHEAEPDAVEEPEDGDGEEAALPADLPAIELLAGAGYGSVADVAAASDEDLRAIGGIGPATLADIRAYVGGD